MTFNHLLIVNRTSRALSRSRHRAPSAQTGSHGRGVALTVLQSFIDCQKKYLFHSLSFSLTHQNLGAYTDTYKHNTHTLKHRHTDTQTDEHTHSNTHAHTHTHKASTETQTHTNTHTNTDTYTFKACINIHFFLTLLSSIVLNNLSLSLSLSLSVAPLYPSLFFLSLPFFLYTSRSLRGQKRPGMCKKRPILSL